MAQVQKKGGPYNKLEQKQRRDKVYELHFEKGYPAVKVAQILGVNRNTVNEDIKRIYSEMSDELPEHGIFLLQKQIQRLEIHRAKLAELFETENEFNKKMTVSRQLVRIDTQILQHKQRLAFNGSKEFSELRQEKLVDKMMKYNF